MNNYFKTCTSVEMYLMLIRIDRIIDEYIDDESASSQAIIMELTFLLR